MGSSLSIENITSGLTALQKVRQLYVNDKERDGTPSKASVLPDRLSLFQEVLSAINNFTPKTRGNSSFANAFRLGSQYSSAYRELKQHIRSMNRSSPRQDEVIKTLKLVTPILDNRSRIYMDKVVKILDILQS